MRSCRAIHLAADLASLPPAPTSWLELQLGASELELLWGLRTAALGLNAYTVMRFIAGNPTARDPYDVVPSAIYLTNH
jgi:hypothetical protein